MTAVTAHKHIMASINSRFDRDVDTIDANDAEESFVRIEPFSSDNLVSMRSSKRQGNGGTISLHPPCSSPTFDQHTRLPVRNRSRKKRSVSKNGSLKVSAKNVPRKTKLYFADIFTTMIDLHWPWVILIFCGSYVLSWILFGLIWWLLVALRGPSVCVTEVNKEIKLPFYYSDMWPHNLNVIHTCTWYMYLHTYIIKLFKVAYHSIGAQLLNSLKNVPQYFCFFKLNLLFAKSSTTICDT